MEKTIMSVTNVITKHQKKIASHKKSVHDQSKFQCEQCNYKASRKHHLQSHVKSQHDKNQMNIEIFLRNIRIYD